MNQTLPPPAELDSFDRKILEILSVEARISMTELATRVGLSKTPVLARVKRLEKDGIITGYRALINAPALGYDLVAFCMVGLKHQSDANLKSFAELRWSIG